MSYVLVIYIYAGMLAKGDSVALLSVPMVSAEACQRAASQASSLVNGSAKEYRSVCLKNDK